MPKPTEAPLDLQVGMEYYITDCGGVGGRLRSSYEDFIVEEVLIDGMVISLKAPVNIKPKPGPYTWIIIEKRGIDTISLVVTLSRRLGVKLSDVSYGGLKDTKAVATQVISIKGITPMQLEGLDLGPRVRVVASFSMDKPFTPSEIWGNQFTIVIRGITGDESVFNCVIEQVMERGLPSYYGYQRFGLRRPNSHIIGKLIIMGDFEKAVEELVAKPYPYEDDTIRKARELAGMGEYSKALELLPRSIRYLPERLVLKQLLMDPGNYMNALSKLPVNLLKLYVEAYQSYLFNKALSARIGRGISINRAVDGDLIVLLDEHGLPTGNVIKAEGSMVDKVNSIISKGRATVVGHLVGYRSRFNNGVQGEIELSVLKAEGIEPSDFKVSGMPKLATGGGVRWLSIKPIIHSISVNGSNAKLIFKLPKGNYATTLLREFIKPNRPELDF
ncbi:tRNA pseudouridine(13) synthase TruD [Caldivirga maquilingensis]|uniref:Probable tRNA pseudouridine synthase D n=1 Tax=Caldivirga maquilingensis (strain ATCC 700844 / DSM 13496 / JCM 10307 / IC-167) TaxID=397948 RepID=A8M9S8_CALMQ|nr:tRNA pseudouridine(13) synthase TruD [Caldivirga maquilingensis]ABW02399.1 tRNA pseudouridine synthase D TruD [Caldivirga maquilingensis IC-167]